MDINNPNHPLNPANKDREQYKNLSKSLNKMEEQLSFGEQLVGIKFNPANDDSVSQIKQKMAEIANLVNDFKGNGSYLENLIKGDALRCILHAQMSCVKLVTLKY